MTCQDIEPRTISSCPEHEHHAQNILNTTTAVCEIFHPQNLTISNNRPSFYNNKFLKIINLLNSSKSIVIRIADKALAVKGIKLSYLSWVKIEKFSSNDSIKIELMN